MKRTGEYIAQAGKAIGEVVKDQNFQLGFLSSIPPTIGVIYLLINKYKKQTEEKQELYKKALAKHNAVIKELTASTELTKEREECLLAIDSKLKLEMNDLQAEIENLKKQIIELEEKKGRDE